MLIQSFQSELLKTKRSAASWLSIGGAFLLPVIMLADRLLNFDDQYKISQSKKLWEMLFFRAWNVSNAMLLPLGIILATGLVAQLEFRNNAWKQWLTTPQSVTTVFFVKLSVVFYMLLQFFILFNVGIYLAGILPSIIFRGIPFPEEPINFVFFLKANAKFFIDCLPVLALQYLISIRFKNILVPLAIGIGLYVVAVVGASWKYGYIIPYTYNIFNAMQIRPIDPTANWHVWALGYFVIITVVSYLLFITKKEKG